MSGELPQFACRHLNCGKSYSSKYNLRRHIESSHSKIKRFRCRSCGKYLSSKQNLQEHHYTHSQEKPYICKEMHCGKAFRQSSQLSNHKKLHQELMDMHKNQSQFKELKVKSIQLTWIFRDYIDEPSDGVSQEPTVIVNLPGLSGPQIPVTLPSFYS